MSNYFKPVAAIIRELPALDTYLVNAHNYYAHLPSNVDDFFAKETLEEHISLVNDYLVRLTDAHNLDIIIDKLIRNLKEDIDYDTGNYLKYLFVNTIVFHDFGKINEKFQFQKMRNPLFNKSELLKSPIDATHSSLGAFIYLTRHLNEIVLEKKQDSLLLVVCFYLSYSIFKHHSRYFNNNCVATISFAELRARNNWEEEKSLLKNYLDTYQFQVHPTIFKVIGEEKFINNSSFNKYVNSFELYALCRLNFSLLTASDYLATNEYMNNLPITDFGTLTSNRINELYYNISKREWLDEEKQKVNYNKVTYDVLDTYKFQNPKEKSGSNLNVLRKEMAIEVIRQIRNHPHQNLFFIEAPTGGGKTNLSLLATLELLRLHNGDYNKVFYVFPFTTLITQTYQTIKEMLGLEHDEIIELHSKSGLKTTDNEDDTYGGQKKNYIDHLFVNYPFTLLSHIRFFDILKTNEKEGNYLLHRMANSIVVIDELQSYNPAHWDKVIYFIRQYAEKFNIKFILMSATLPKLDKLNVIKQEVNDFVYLLPKAKESYFNNPNFSGRVHFNFDFFGCVNLSVNELSEKVIDSSIEYLEYDFGKAKPKESVYTIVEFIYKQTATDFYGVIKEYDFFDEIFVLSGTILEHRRKQIINALKNPINRSKKILLITTQVVEAGVDIDMDLGFKDRSIIDSDEQLAGRINRNVNKGHCTLYLFNLNKESVIYGKDYRYKITKEQIKENEYKRILKEKDFDYLYDRIFDERNKWNVSEMAENLKDYKDAIHKLKFQTVHEEFKLIEQQNISCFIPLNIPIEIESTDKGKFEKIFSESELTFLKQHNVYPDKENKVNGAEVFDVYINSIYNKIEFTAQQIRKKTLQNILSKYTFSIFASPKMEEKLAHFYDFDRSEYGYVYLEHWKDVYSIEKGLDALKLVGIEETQFL